MKLFYAPGACSLASHIVLREIERPFDIERVDLAAKKTASGADFLAINPKGCVPTLATDDGEILTEGAAILQYVADAADKRSLSPAAGSLARARVQEMLNFTSSELHKAFGPLFAPLSSPEAKSAARARVGQNLDWLESRLADGRVYLTGDGFTVADAYAFVVAGWAPHCGIEIGRWPHVAAFLDRVAKRASVVAARAAEA
jgi:glutathione S-transferase